MPSPPRPPLPFSKTRGEGEKEGIPEKNQPAPEQGTLSFFQFLMGEGAPEAG